MLRRLPILVVVAVLATLVVASVAQAAYTGSTGVTSTGSPGGGGASSGRVLFYDLTNTDANVSWPTDAQFRGDALCGYLTPYFNTGTVPTPSQVAACEKRVGASILGIGTGQFDPSGDAQCRLANRGPCWTNSASGDPHGVTSPPRSGRSGWGEMHNSGYLGQNSVATAKTVIAWNVKVWRYDPRSGDGRTGDPIFERRVGLDAGGFTDDGQAPGCSASQSANCVSQDEWWRGGRSQPADNWWWANRASAGPLGPTPANGDASVCQQRWNAYRSKWQPAANQPAKIASYVGLSGAANACFWTANDMAGRGYDTSVFPFPSAAKNPNSALTMESIGLAWTFVTATGQVKLKYKVVGRPGYLYAVLVTPVDNREQIVGPGQVQGQKPTAPGGYFRTYFASSPNRVGGAICGTTYINTTPGKATPERGVSTGLTLSGAGSGTTRSASNGQYCFNGLQPGTYSIKAATPTGSTPKNPASGIRTRIVLPPGGTVADQDFHFYVGAGANAGIGGRAFYDQNQNGQPDTDEPDLGPTTFALSGAASRSLTSPEGQFGFSRLGPGNYQATADPPSGYTATGDSDGQGNGAASVAVTLAANQYKTVWFGFYKPCVACEQSLEASGGFPAPQVAVAGPETAITGRANDYGLTIDWPAGGINYDQALWPLSSTNVVLDPQSGVTQSSPSGASVSGFGFYDSLMNVNEASAPTGPAWPSAPTASMSPCPGLPAGTPCAGAGLLARAANLDVNMGRDESGDAQFNAAVTPDFPFQMRDFNLAWLSPSLEPELPASVGGYATYQAGRLVQPVSEAADAAGHDWRDPQTSCGDAPAGSHCITADQTLRPGVSRLSDMHQGRHQLAEAYQYHPFDAGFFSAHLDTNDAGRVETLSVYDRGSDNGSRKGRVYASDDVAARYLRTTASEVAGNPAVRTAEDNRGWNIYFCRSGGWGDARIFNGKDLTFGRNSGTEVGDQGCRGDSYVFEWGDSAADCRVKAPPANLPYLNAVNTPKGVDLRGQMPWEKLRRCGFRNPDGYVQSGTWHKSDWQFDLDTGCTLQNPANHPSPAGDPVPAGRIERCTFKSNGTTRNGWRPGHWYVPSMTFVWSGVCARTKPNLPSLPPAGVRWGNDAGYNNDGAGAWTYNGARTQTGRLFDDRGGVFDSDNVKRCTFDDDAGYQWNGSWTKRDRENGHGSPTGRLPAGEYTIVADYASGASSATTWKITTNQFARRGSRWEWQRNAFGGTEMAAEASPVTTTVLALQPTR